MYSLRNKNTGRYLTFPANNLWLTESLTEAEQMLNKCQEYLQGHHQATAELIIIKLPKEINDGCDPKDFVWAPAVGISERNLSDRAIESVTAFFLRFNKKQ